MADNTRTSFTDFLYQLRGKVWQVFPTEAPFLAELSGVGDPNSVGRYTREMDGNRDTFSGDFVRHTIVLAQLPGGGFVSETGTWNVPHVLSTTQAQIKLVRLVQPFSITVDVERDSINNSAASAVEQLTDQARIALARNENWALLGDGTGKVSDITGGSSPGLTITVSSTGLAPMDVLLPGTVWDILTKSTAAATTGGLRRIIASVSDSATTQTVTFSTTQQASDGDSGNITFSTSEGIYIPGSGSTAANAGTLTCQGLEQAAAATGTFENIAKGTVQQWQGTDGRSGDTSTLPLSAQMLDRGVRVGRRAGLGKWDFAIGDPAVIDLYKQGLQAQVRYEEQTMTVPSGFRGIVYDGADAPIPLIKEPSHKKGSLRMIDKASFQMYGDQKGPSFLDDDGAMFRRFARSLPKEAELLDRFQLGVTKCNTIVKYDNLQQAS